jgi:hypothetical protein
MLDSISDKRLQVAIVHLDRNLNLHLAPRRNEMYPQVFRQPKLIGGTLEILVGCFKWSHGVVIC